MIRFWCWAEPRRRDTVNRVQSRSTHEEKLILFRVQRVIRLLVPLQYTACPSSPDLSPNPRSCSRTSPRTRSGTRGGPRRRRAAAGSGACCSPRRRPSSWSVASGSSATCPPRRGSTWPGWSASPRTRWRSGSRTTATRWSEPGPSAAWRRCSCCRAAGSPSRYWCRTGSPATGTWRVPSGPASACLCAPAPRCCTAPSTPACRSSTPGCSSWRTCTTGAGEDWDWDHFKWGTAIHQWDMYNFYKWSLVKSYYLLWSENVYFPESLVSSNTI